MDISPHLVILRLIIQGVNKVYQAKFEAGLNLVWGDMDSGKSSILNLIDYCLGGKNENLLYGEIKAHGRIAFLEVDLNGKVFTFERDILAEKSIIRIYTGLFDERASHFPLLVAASPGDSVAPDGWISDFILDNLGIAKVSIKESRLREDSSSDRLSFRDLMKLLYLKQTRVGSDALLNYGAPTVFNKNVEIQKFVFNIYDDKLSALQTELAKEMAASAELEKNEQFIRKFLRDVNIAIDDFDAVKEAAENHVTRLLELDESLHLLKEDFVLASDIGATIASAIKDTRQGIRTIDARLSDIDYKYANFAKLSNTYRFDLDALNLSKISRSIIHVKNPKAGSILCPLCQSQLESSSPAVEDEDLDFQIKSLRNRESGIQQVLTGLRNEQRSLLSEKSQLSKALAEATRSFDENNLASISPMVTSIQAIEIARTQIKVDLAEVERNLSISNKFIDIGSKLEVKGLLMEKLRRTIKIVKDGLLGLDEVVAELTGLLNSHLQKSGLQNVHSVFVDKKFTAHFRGISYYNTSSGGVRTITSIALYVTRLQYLLEHACNLPTFLMIDTPGQNIGRFRSNDDNTEVSDPKLYENIFNQIVEVLENAAIFGRRCQVIIVDNDLPESLKEGGNFHLVKRFSKQGGKFEKGLIDDA